ncbi:transposase family protein [Micromonospora sp. NPDC048999]|uniref:transposase family protein n=1 Tax=Micromonospora sp. NPDC048999 TaxID=3155391 RepID=UPI0033F87061
MVGGLSWSSRRDSRATAAAARRDAAQPVPVTPPARHRGGAEVKISEVLSSLIKALPRLSDVVVDGVERSAGAIVLRARSRTRRGRCPRCSRTSGRAHGRYRRRLADAALGGRAVVIDLLVRRFKCVSKSCAAMTFAEQVPGLTHPHSRRTPALQHQLVQFAVALAARPAARLAGRLGVPVAADGGRARNVTGLARPTARRDPVRA